MPAQPAESPPGAPPAPGGVYTAGPGGERLDLFLAAQTGRSRHQVQQLIAAGTVRVDGRAAKASRRLEPGESVEVTEPPVSTGIRPQALALEVAYEDADLLVVNKPAGVIVHPAPGHPDGTVANAVAALVPSLAGTDRPGIVHRLDKDTSGLLVVAKHVAAQDYLARQFRDRTVSKHYLALVEGRLTPAEGAIEAPIGRDPVRRDRMAVREGGRAARSSYRVLGVFGGFSYVLVGLETGRTHQIRVHLAAIGHPVAGDPVYGHPLAWCPRQFLHAHRLAFDRPSDGRRVTCEAPLPPDLLAALAHVAGVAGAAPLTAGLVGVGPVDAPLATGS